MMLRRIYADNFRCLGNFEFRPGTMNLLLGENGSGKTSLFEILLYLRDLVVAGSSNAAVFTLSKTIWDRRNLQSFGLEIDQAGGTFSYHLEIHHPTERPEHPLIQRESLDFDGKPLFRYSEGQVRLFDEDHSPGAQFPFRAEQSFIPNLESQNEKIQVFKSFMAGSTSSS